MDVMEECIHWSRVDGALAVRVKASERFKNSEVTESMVMRTLG